MPFPLSDRVSNPQHEQRHNRDRIISHSLHESVIEDNSDTAVSSLSEQSTSSTKGLSAPASYASKPKTNSQLHDGASAPSQSTSSPPSRYTLTEASPSPYASDEESEPVFPLLGVEDRRSSLSDRHNTPKWWNLGRLTADNRRRRREAIFGLSTIKRSLRRLIRHPFFPRQPRFIMLSLLIFTVVAILITLLLMHVLNPDKAPLPWRIYCSLPPASTSPPATNLSPTYENLTIQLPRENDSINTLISDAFPPSNLDESPPVGIYLAVFSIDTAIERRMLIRSTWASHDRSRVGAGSGDGGLGTSRTIVRFVLGKPRADWERRIQLESDTYNDMVELPISENMNSGKTHAFFTWAAENAWVPPSSRSVRSLSYSNVTAPPPPSLAPHDPKSDLINNTARWVRPDFIVKADDDAFVMLAELESRLRVQLEEGIKASQKDGHSTNPPDSQHDDPLIYWGYLVKNRFMAGELYSLSWSLVNWVASTAAVKTMTRGAEDKQTAKWMRIHPRAEEIRWASERCWIYDHPRAGTVYSHGFLFPSEARRVRKSVLSLLKPMASILSSAVKSLNNNPVESATSDLSPSPPTEIGINDKITTTTYSLPSTTTPSYSYSSISQFGVHYTFPISTLSLPESVEALVEGSKMSQLSEGEGPETVTQAWARREDRQMRYEGKRVGGTVAVHFIKRNEWFLETALALLGGDEVREDRRTTTTIS